MNLNFKGKKVIISGGSKGLGRELALSFAEEGAKVCYGARTKMKDIQHDDSFIYLECNFLEENDILSFASQALDLLDGVDILINNVGGSINNANMFDLEYIDWINTYKLNVLSSIVLTKACYEFLKISSNPRVINISSNTAIQPGYMNPHYSSSKAGINHLTKYLSNLFAKDNILVNAVAIGSFLNDSWDEYISQKANIEKIDNEIINKREINYMISQIPLKKLGTYSEIIPIINLLSSNECSWMTGSCIVLDGGKVKCV